MGAIVQKHDDERIVGVVLRGNRLPRRAGKQEQDRRTRKGRWEAKFKEVMTEIKANGLSVEESLAAAMSNTAMATAAYGREPMLRVDNKLQRDLVEAYQRIDIHDRAAEEYAAWRSMMYQAGERRVVLTHADWVYFFGGLDKAE